MPANCTQIATLSYMKFTKLKLRTEIGLILLIKIVLVFIIWRVFFSDPVQSHLTDQKVTDHYLGIKIQ